MSRWASYRPPGADVSWPSMALFALAVVVALAIAFLPPASATVLVVGAFVALLAFINPLFGLGAALLLGPFGALESIAFGPALLDSGQLALMLTFAAWIGGGLARRRLYVRTSPLNLPWLLFVLIAALTLLDSYSVVLGLVELLKWLEMGLIIWLILDLATDPSRRPAGYVPVSRLLLAMLLTAGLVQALIGIWQFGLRDTGPEHFIILERFYRAYGTFEQPNPFGGYMNLTALPALGLLMGLIIAWFESRRRGVAIASPAAFRAWLVFAAICAGTASLAVVLSWSRGAWLGFMAGAVVLVVFSTRRVLFGLGLAMVAAALVGGGILFGAAAGVGPAQALTERLGGFREEFTPGDVRGVDINDANYSVVERLAHWQAANDMARDDLWSGVGFGNYAAAYPDYALINFPDALGHAHNYYLNLLAEVGVPGLLAYGLFWLVIVVQTMVVANRAAWPERGVVVGLLAAWTALAVHHLVDKLYVNNIYVHLGVMIGLLQLFAWSGFRVRSRGSRRKESQEIRDL